MMRMSAKYHSSLRRRSQHKRNYTISTTPSHPGIRTRPKQPSHMIKGTLHRLIYL